MNDLSANDILLFGALAGVLVVIVLGLCWAVAHRGRQRWSAEHVDRMVAERIQIITANPGDAVVFTYPGVLTPNQRTQIIAAIERRLSNGVNAMVLDGGLRMSHVVSVKDAPNPIPQPAPFRRQPYKA